MSKTKRVRAPGGWPCDRNVFSVYLPDSTRERLKERAAAAGIPVSQLVAAWVELGDIDGTVGTLRRFAALPLEVAPEAVRPAVAKMQGAA